MILGGWNNSRNLRHPFPRVADVNCLRQLLVELPEKKPPCVSGPWQKLRPLLLNRLPLRVGAVTDCFQRYMESRTHTGLELLRILTETKYPAQIVTKSDLLAENDYLEAMRGNQENLLIQVSMTTAHDDISSRLEPGAPPSSRRLRALSILVKEGFLTTARINPLFPIYPDSTLTNLALKSGIGEVALLKDAGQGNPRVLPIFDLELVDELLRVFKDAPSTTKGRHTILAGFVRLPFATVKWVAKAINWSPAELKSFFSIRRGNCYYYSQEEIRHYYEALRHLCQAAEVPFSICYDSDLNFEIFRGMWANPLDCCNALGNVPGFTKVFSNCC